MITKSDLEHLASKICSSIGWVSMWTFFIMLRSCDLATSHNQREVLDELKKQNTLLQQCVSLQTVKQHHPHVSKEKLNDSKN